LVGVLRASLRNGFSDVLWLEKHGEEQRRLILPAAIRPRRNNPRNAQGEFLLIRTRSLL
jgi:hypothetical protein